MDSILEAVFIVSPKMVNLGSLNPTNPVTCGRDGKSEYFRNIQKTTISLADRNDAIFLPAPTHTGTYAGSGVKPDPDLDRLPIVRHHDLR